MNPVHRWNILLSFFISTQYTIKIITMWSRAYLGYLQIQTPKITVLLLLKPKQVEKYNHVQWIPPSETVLAMWSFNFFFGPLWLYIRMNEAEWESSKCRTPLPSPSPEAQHAIKSTRGLIYTVIKQAQLRARHETCDSYVNCAASEIKT